MNTVTQEETLDYKRLADIEVDGIDTRDYPDFCDAYICSGSYQLADGTYRDLTEGEIEQLNDDGDFVYNQVESKLY